MQQLVSIATALNIRLPKLSSPNSILKHEN
jgi:hypothetical protein